MKSFPSGSFFYVRLPDINKKRGMRSLVRLISRIIKNPRINTYARIFIEVPGGFEPPYAVLQTAD